MRFFIIQPVWFGMGFVVFYSKMSSKWKKSNPTEYK